MLIAVDFDGTIVKHKYPEIGHLVPGALEGIRELQANGHQVSLYTCRTGDELTHAVRFLQLHDMEFHSINYNRWDDEFGTGGIKMYADIYIDDKAVGTPLFQGSVCWPSVMGILQARGVVAPEGGDNE